MDVLIIFKKQNYSGHMQTLSDRKIFKPDESKYRPNQENLDHRRQEVYRKT